MLPIKNDIEQAIAVVRQENAALAEPLTEMIFSSIEKQRDDGWNITYLGSMLTAKTDFIFHDDGQEVGHDGQKRLFFYLLKVDQQGNAINVCTFLVINLTLGIVTDNSAHIVSKH